MLQPLSTSPGAAGEARAGNARDPAPLLLEQDASPGGDAAIHSEILPVGTTFDDLVRAGRITDPRSDAALDAIIPNGLDPGTAPEGDDLGWMSFTPDGNRVLLTNRGTDNVSVYDWATQSVLATIPVGRYPAGVACTNNVAVVACAFSNAVYLIDLATYTVTATVATGEQPWVVRLSPDGTRAYVACDIANTCEVIDIATATTVRVIPNFPIWLSRYSYNSENGRNFVGFSEFEITPDGRWVVVPDGLSRVFFYNTLTSLLDYTVVGVPNGVALQLSGDGTRAVVVSATTPVSVWQIDLQTHMVTGTVTMPGYQLFTLDLAVNADGSKAFIGITNNSSAIVRFVTSDSRVLTSTLTPFWIGESPDRSKAISGQYNFSIVDFASEVMISQSQGNSQEFGAVSPTGARVVSHDPNRHEGLYFYDYAGGVVSYLGSAWAGVLPEADCPRRVAITPDGGKAVVTNVLSDNAVVLNLNALVVEATIPIGDRVQDVAITSDSRWAVVCGMESGAASVLDLSTAALVANVPTNARPSGVSIAPDDAVAYVANVMGNTISIVALAGAASHQIADIPCGEIGASYTAYTVSSEVEASPGGRYALVAVSFDDQVKVVDSVTGSVVATLPVGDFPLELSFDGTGDYAVVGNAFSDTYTVIRVNGAASSVVGNFPAGDFPIRSSYDPVHDRVGIANLFAKTVSLVDPQSGALQGTLSYSAYGNPVQVLFDAAGDPMVLTQTGSTPPGYLVTLSDVISLPAMPSYFAYSPAAKRAVVVMPGPDWVTVISWNTTGVGDIHTLPLTGRGAILGLAPNPAGRRAEIRFALARDASVELVLVDISGREVRPLASGSYAAGEHQVAWSRADDLPSGAYFVVLRLDGVVADSRKLVLVE